MKQMWSGNDDVVESPLARLESLPRDPLYIVVMKTEPSDVFNLSNTNKRFKDLFCGTDERSMGFRANYVTQHRDYDWSSLNEEVLLMWIDSLIENTDWASADANYAFRLAAEKSHLKVMRLLLNTPNHGIDPAADNNYAIRGAAWNDKFEVMRSLLNTPDCGIDPDANAIYAILQKAADKGHVEVVRLLLNTPDRGIDPAALNNYAIRHAAANGLIKVVRLLLNTPDRGIDPDHAIRNAARYGHIEVVRLLLNTPDRGIDPDAYNNCAVKWAANNGHVEVVRLLLGSGRVNPEGIESYSEEINDLICNYKLKNKV